MLELILMFALGRFNGVRARRKGYDFRKFMLRSILFFIIGEIIGICIVLYILNSKGVNLANQKEVMEVMIHNYQYQLIALATGVGGALWVWNQVDKLPIIPPNGNEKNQGWMQ